MTITYQGEKPLFKSVFRSAANGNESFYSVFLGNSKDINNNPVDLFILTYSDGSNNIIQVYGDKDPQYISGVESVIHTYMNDPNNKLNNLIIERAISAGVLTPKTVFMGFSFALSDMADKEYRKTDYVVNRPNEAVFYEELEARNLNDNDYDDAIETFNCLLDAYDKEYISNHGEIPENPNLKNYHIFKDEDEAKSLAKKDKCIYEEITFISNYHLDAIARIKNFDINLITSCY